MNDLLNNEFNERKTALLMTWYATQNYGTLLQGFATKEIFEQRYGYNVYFPKYTPVGKRDIWSIIKKCINLSVWKKRIRNYNEKKKITKYGLNDKLEQRIQMVNSFVKDYRYANDGQTIRTQEDFLQIGNKFDLYISGSDQIWNPQFLNERFLLDFVPSNKKCISFASSLSTRKIPENKVSIYKKLLEKYDGITVREPDCVKQLSTLLHKDVGCIMDHTLIYGSSNWKKLQKPISQNGYVLLYLLGQDMEPRLKAMELAKASGRELYHFPQMSGGFTFADLEVKGHELWDVEPFRWITLIQNAEYILTDSFHMTVFSVMFHKKFHVVIKDWKNIEQNNRILNLLQLVGLEDRFVEIENIDESCFQESEVDWNNVDLILEKERQKSLAYIDQIMAVIGDVD